MDLEGIMFIKMSDRERQMLYDITYTWNPKNKINKYKKAKPDSSIENKLVVTS